MEWFEVNFDGLVGPTHNYAGLSYGNLASSKNRNRVSNPRRAALQGLTKMRLLYDLGVPQAVLPPQMRPDLGFLRNCGFRGSDEVVVQTAAKQDPVLLAAASSSACMWTANAATVSPSVDASDQRLHLTPANLVSGLHRSLECGPTLRVLQNYFSSSGFCIHSGLSPAIGLADEGAANHMRLTPSHGQPGLEVFVYGTDSFDSDESKPVRFPARQSKQAFESIARLHQLDAGRTLFWKQNPAAIDHGAFHNDVVAVANENVLFCHELAFENQAQKLAELQELFQDCYGDSLFIIEVSNQELPMPEAVKTYLFNSQIVTLRNRTMALIAPVECEKSQQAKAVIDRVLAGDNPISEVHFPDVRQSMDNGGGPACLRLRVAMNEKQFAEMHQTVLFSPALESELKAWIVEHYRERLDVNVNDLGDASLYLESRKALVELEQLLELNPGVLVTEDA